MPGTWIEKTEPECLCPDKPNANLREFGPSSKWQCECGNRWIYTGISWELMVFYPSLRIEMRPEKNWFQRTLWGK